MNYQSDVASNLILNGPKKYIPPSIHPKPTIFHGDCWSDLKDTTEETFLEEDDDSKDSIFVKIQKKNLNFQKIEKYKRKLGTRIKPCKETDKHASCFSARYEESIRRSEPRCRSESVVELYSSEPKDILQKEKWNKLLVPPKRKPSNSNIQGTLTIRTKLKKMSRFSKSMTIEKTPLQVSKSTSTIFAAIALKKKLLLRKAESLFHEFDLDYIDAWCQPVHDPLVENFEIAFQNKLREAIALSRQLSQKSSVKQETLSKKNLFANLTSIDYRELLLELNLRGRKPNDIEKWTWANEIMDFWTKINNADLNKLKKPHSTKVRHINLKCMKI